MHFILESISEYLKGEKSLPLCSQIVEIEKKENLKIRIESEEYEIPFGGTLEEIAKAYQEKIGKIILGARLNNSIVELFRPIARSGEVSFITLDSQDGLSIYQRGLFFILHATVRKLYKKRSILQ